jgi:glutaredoxin
MSALVLYGTTHCHLCEEAEAVLSAAGVTTDYIDIANSDELSENYGTRIPVLRRADDGTELGWPFDAAAVRRFVA